MWHKPPQNYIVMSAEISQPRGKQLKDPLRHNLMNTKQPLFTTHMLYDNEEEGDPRIPHTFCTYKTNLSQ